MKKKRTIKKQNASGTKRVALRNHLCYSVYSNGLRPSERTTNMTPGENNVIVTAQAGAEQCARNELERAGVGLSGVRWLAPCVGLAAMEGGFLRLAEAFRRQPPIFIRHMCPASLRVPHDGDARTPALLTAEVMHAFAARIDPLRSFAVQAVFLGDADLSYKRFDVQEQMANALVQEGAMLEVARPAQVISVVHLPNEAYLGISEAEDNLSDWGGGARRFAQEPEQISRAEFKLLEALEAFRIALPEAGTALDLGAAPGGWTRVLRGRGLLVVAVDPAALDPRLAEDTGVTHFRGTAQRFLETPRVFDIIVNDMRMDARESARIMGQMADCLDPAGLAIMTLKLPHQGMQRQAAQAIALLETWYRVVAARQLFHNRAEVTVVLRRK